MSDSRKKTLATKIIFALLIFVMDVSLSGAMSFIITYAILGTNNSSFLNSWLRSWLIAYIVGIQMVTLIRSAATKITPKIVDRFFHS